MQITDQPGNKAGSLFLLAGMLLLFSMLACEQQKTAIAAPLNDLGTLEKLAAAYEQLSEQIPTSPVTLAPKARKKFVEQVFENAGFGYSETLESLAKVQRTEVTKLHRDMQELLFLPHYRLEDKVRQEIYNEQQQKAINMIELNFR